MKRLNRSLSWVVPILMWTSSAASLGSQPIAIDAASQYKLYLKVLSFDRNLKARVGEGLIIGIMYVPGSRESRQARDEIARAVAAGPADFQGIPIRAVTVEYGKEAAIETALAAGSVDVLYVTPLEPYDLAPVRDACRARRISTFTGVPAYVERGLSVSFAMNGRRAEVLINLGNSRAEGSDLSSRLLDMVTVVGGSSRGEAR